MFYVIANQQDLHMAQLIKIIELMGREDLSKRLEHINFGLVLGMSTRRGTVRFLDDMRDTAETMHDVMRKNDAKYAQVEDPEKTADVLGISAVIVQDMSGKRFVLIVWQTWSFPITDSAKDQQLHLRHATHDVV
jgi:arginyl-tRNA synthetase